MSKQKVELHELRDGRVSFLSLVDAGAARTPFKIQKAEKEGGPVINFKDIFKDEPFKPRVLAVAVKKGADLDKAKTVIEKAGLITDRAVDMDGTAVFEQGEGALESGRGDTITVKIDESVAAIVDVQKGFQPFSGSSDFATNVQAEGFLPSMELSIDALRTSVFNGLFDTDGDASSAKSQVSQAAKDFASHVESLVKDLPDEVFKLEEVVKQEFAQFDGTRTEKPEERDGVDSGSSSDANLTAGETGTAGLAGSQDNVQKTGGSDDKGNPFAKKKKDDMKKTAEVLKALGLSDEQVAAVSLVIEKQVGIAPSGVATGGESLPGPLNSVGSAVVDEATDQEDNGLVGPESDATVDSATSSMPGVTPQPTGVSKDELKAALDAQLEVIKTMFTGVNERLGTVEKAAGDATDVAKQAAQAVGTTVLGDAQDDAAGRQAEVTYSEPAFIDTGMAALAD